MVDLIPKEPGQIIEKLPDYHIRPETRDAWVEMVVLGLRSLTPYHFQLMQNPCLEIEVSNAGKEPTIVTTNNSKKPNTSNPNFLERLTIPISLPMNPIFAQPLFLRVRDFRLGGYLKPVVATGIVKIDEKIPDSPNYKPPGSEMYMCPEEEALAAKAKVLGGSEESSSSAETVSDSLTTSGDITGPSFDKTALEIRRKVKTIIYSNHFTSSVVHLFMLLSLIRWSRSLPKKPTMSSSLLMSRWTRTHLSPRGKQKRTLG